MSANIYWRNYKRICETCWYYDKAHCQHNVAIHARNLGKDTRRRPEQGSCCDGWKLSEDLEQALWSMFKDCKYGHCAEVHQSELRRIVI